MRTFVVVQFAFLTPATLGCFALLGEEAAIACAATGTVAAAFQFLMLLLVNR